MTPETTPAPAYNVRRFARDFLFWAGVAYLLILLTVMTPYTYQLDDIKVSILHTAGPILTVAYLALLALGWVAPPRRALRWTLGGYLGVVTLSAIFAPGQSRWEAWDGWWMQFALVGPFLAFMGGGGGVVQVRRVSALVMLLALYSVVFGVGHCGLPGRPGLPELMRAHYGLNKIEKNINDYYKEASNPATTLERRKILRESIIGMQREVSAVRNTFQYKLVNTLATAKGTMMSFILNRDFFASFLLLTVPFSLVVLLNPASRRGRALAWSVAIAFAILTIANAVTKCPDPAAPLRTVSYIEAMVPNRAFLSALVAAAALLGFAVAGRWRAGNPWAGVAYAGGTAFLFYLAWAAGTVPGNDGLAAVPLAPFVLPRLVVHLKPAATLAIFLLAFLPVAGAVFHWAAGSLNQRIAGASALVVALGCLGVGYYGGFVLVLLGTLLTLLALRAPAILWRMLAAVTIVGGMCCLVGTNSKVSMYLAVPVQLAVAAAVLLFPARLHLGGRWRLIVLAGCSALLLGTGVMVSSYGSKAVAQFDTQAIEERADSFLNPMIARQIMWTGGLRIWERFPILGGGPKCYLVYFPQYRRPDYFLYEISHVTLSCHNFFIDLLSETGVCGFVTFMAFLAVLYAGIVRRSAAAQTREVRLMSACLAAAMAGFLLENVFDVNARWPIGAGPFWAILGVLAGFVNRPATQQAGAAENDDEDPAVEPVWRPSPVQAQVLWFALGLCVLGGIRNAAYSRSFFAGSKANNDGLSLLGEPSPAEARGPLLVENDRIREIDRQLRTPGLPPAEKDKLTQERANTVRYYDQDRQEAIGHFQCAIRYNPHFVTSYYKLASIQSMRDYAGGASDAKGLEEALKTYSDMRKFTPDFSQVRLNLGIVNEQMAQLTGDSTYKAESIKNLRLAVRQTINTQPRMPGETESFCSALLPNDEAFHHPWPLTPKDFPQPEELARLLRAPKTAVARAIAARMQKAGAKPLDEPRSDADKTELAKRLADGLNAVLEGDCIYEPAAWAKVTLSGRTKERIEAKPTPEECGFVNRALLAQAFPDLIEWVPADEAAEAAARLRHAWTDLLVKDVPIRLPRAAVEDNIRRAAELEASIASNAGWTRDALRALDAVKNLNIEDEDWLTEVVTFFSHTRDDAGLAKFLDEYVERQPEAIQARSDLAVILSRQGRLREAQRQALIVAQLDPARDDVHYVGFDVARAMGDRPAALRAAGLYLKTGKNSVWKRTIEEYMKQQSEQ